MELLPRAEGSAFVPPKAPFLEGFEYDGGGFTGYPARMGFDKNAFLSGDFSQHVHPAETISSFLQAWLFFGLMCTVFDERIAMEDFVVTNENGQRTVTTAKLPEYARRWVAKLRQKKPPNLGAIVEDCLQEASNYSIHLSGGWLGATTCPLPSEVSFSIMALGASLDAILHHNRDSVGFEIKKKKWGVPAHIVSAMVSSGWCQNDLKRLAEVGSVALFSFAGTISRREPLTASHAHCTIASCCAYFVPNGAYPTRHVCSSCRCGHRSIPVERTIDILESGSFLVAKIMPGRVPEAYTLQAVSWKSNEEFCAISHVWSDGLGNREGNSLPACQVARLYDLAFDVLSQLSQQTWLRRHCRKGIDPVCIWIDTLCVPRPEGARRIAISMMDKVYSKADLVLVLDNELQHFPISTSKRELLLRVACSGWMRRVWTLLEGSLGSGKLQVQFSDGSLNIAESINSLEKEWSERPFNTDLLDLDVRHFYHELTFIRKAYTKLKWAPDDSHAFGAALHGFVGRSTSWKGDEYLCLAILMGLDGTARAAIYETPVEGRPEKLLSLLKYVPHGLLFCPGPKLEQLGLRWAPLDLWKSRPYINYRPARLRPDIGLEVTYPGFVLPPMKLPLLSFIFQSIGTNQLYKVTYDPTQPPTTSNLEGTEYTSTSSKLAIICPTTRLIRSGPRASDGFGVPAALVSVTRVSNFPRNPLDIGRTGIYTRYICQARLTPPTESEITQAENDLTKARRASIYVGEKIRDILGLQILSDMKEEWLDQTWYVA